MQPTLSAAADAEKCGRHETEGHIDGSGVPGQPIDQHAGGRGEIEQNDRQPGDALRADAPTCQVEGQRDQIKERIDDAERIAEVQVARHVAEEQHATGDQRDRKRLHDHFLADRANLFAEFVRFTCHGPGASGG